MSLEANKFLGRLYGEAIRRQMAQDEEISNKIKSRGKKEVVEVLATKEMDKRDYQFFLRLISNIGYEIYQALHSAEEGMDAGLVESIANIISDWNNIISALSRLKYNSLNPSDKAKVYNNLKELKPSLEQISARLAHLAVGDNVYNGLKDKIDLIIRQINENVFDQVSYPLKEEVAELEEPDEPEEMEEE